MDHPAIALALSETFGQVVPEVVEVLSGGMSPARLYRLTLGSRRYVLRHVLQPGGMGDRRRSLACLRSAADRGLAPHLWYANLDSDITICDFIDAPTLAAWSRGGGDPVPLLAALLRALHSGPTFPAFISVPEGCEQFAAALRTPHALPNVAKHIRASSAQTTLRRSSMRSFNGVRALRATTKRSARSFSCTSTFLDWKRRG